MTHHPCLQFRFARSADINTLVEINIDGNENYRKTNQKVFRELIREKLVLVAIENKDVIALLYWRTEFLGRSNQWYVKQLTVRKNVRGRNVGTELLKHFLNFAKKRGIEKVFGDIHNDNYASLTLCLKLGALISGTIEGVGNTKKKDERVIVRFELFKLKTKAGQGLKPGVDWNDRDALYDHMKGRSRR